MCWRCLMNLPLAFLVTLGDCALMTLCRVRVKRMPTLLALQRRLFTGWMMVGWFHSWKHNCGIEQLELLLVTLGARVMLVTPITLVCWFRWHRCVWWDFSGKHFQATHLAPIQLLTDAIGVNSVAGAGWHCCATNETNFCLLPDCSLTCSWWSRSLQLQLVQQLLGNFSWRLPLIIFVRQRVRFCVGCACAQSCSDSGASNHRGCTSSV